MGLSPSHEGRRFVAVGHIVARATGQQDALREDRYLPLKTRRGSINDELEFQAFQLRQGSRLHRSQRHKLRRQLMGPGCGAVGTDQLLRSCLQQRTEHASRGTARAEQQYALSTQRNAVVLAKVTNEANAIGVVAMAASISCKPERIDRGRLFRAPSAHFSERKGLFFIRQRDVKAHPTGRLKMRDCPCQFSRRHLNGAVHERLAGLPGKLGMDKR